MEKLDRLSYEKLDSKSAHGAICQRSVPPPMKRSSVWLSVIPLPVDHISGLLFWSPWFMMFDRAYSRPMVSRASTLQAAHCRVSRKNMLFPSVAPSVRPRL